MGAAEAFVPRGAGCTDRHRMAFEALRSSTKVPGCRSWSRSVLRAAKPSHEAGWFDEETFDEDGEVEGTGGGPLGSFGPDPPDDGNEPPEGRPAGPLPRAASMGMCDCWSDWSMRL